MVSPFDVFSSKSGAKNPFCGAGIFPDVDAPDLSALTKIQANPRIRMIE
jgi:hypothetical protein